MYLKRMLCCVILLLFHIITSIHIFNVWKMGVLGMSINPSICSYKICYKNSLLQYYNLCYHVYYQQVHIKRVVRNNILYI